MVGFRESSAQIVQAFSAAEVSWVGRLGLRFGLTPTGDYKLTASRVTSLTEDRLRGIKCGIKLGSLIEKTLVSLALPARFDWSRPSQPFRRLVLVFMEAKEFPPKARRMAIESEASTERIFAAVLERGKKSGEFQIVDVGLTAALIKPVVQDWYVKHAKYRRRGIGVDQFVAAATRFLTGATGRRTRR
jgi:hypothetical protein